MENKTKQLLTNSKQSNGLVYLMDSFPKWFGVCHKVVERLNEKGILTPTKRSPYTYQTVYQSIKGRWYDPFIHEELLSLRAEYLAKQSELKKMEIEQNSLENEISSIELQES